MQSRRRRPGRRASSAAFCTADQRFDPLLKSLPAILCVRSRETPLRSRRWTHRKRVQTITHPPEKDVVGAPIGALHLMSETATPAAHRNSRAGRVAGPQSLFLELLRWQLQFAPPGHRRSCRRGCTIPSGPASLSPASCDSLTVIDRRSACRDNKSGLFAAALAKFAFELVGKSPIQYLALAVCIWLSICCKTVPLGVPRWQLERVGYDSMIGSNFGAFYVERSRSLARRSSADNAPRRYSLSAASLCDRTAVQAPAMTHRVTPPPVLAAGRSRCGGNAPAASCRWRRPARRARRSGGPSCRNCR